MRIAIVEDDTADYLQIEQLLRRYIAERAQAEGVTAPPLGIVRFADAAHFQRAYIPGSFSIVVLDCYLETECADALTGMDLAHAIRFAGDDVPILFVTSSVDFAVEGYEVGATAYLVKPVAYAKLAHAFERINLSDFASLGTVITVSLGAPFEAVDLPVDALRSCRVEGHYLFLDLDRRQLEQTGARARSANRATELLRANAPSIEPSPASPSSGMLRTRMSLRQMTDLLANDNRFWLCSRSQIVNLSRVSALSGTYFVMDDGSRVQVSRRKLPEAADRYADELFRQMRSTKGVEGPGASTEGFTLPHAFALTENVR